MNATVFKAIALGFVGELPLHPDQPAAHRRRISDMLGGGGHVRLSDFFADIGVIDECGHPTGALFKPEPVLVEYGEQLAEGAGPTFDAALSDASSHLDPSGKVEIHKVIFGLPADWIGADKISSPRLHLLKALSEKLDLVPVGFVVTPEAATKYLQSTEGVPPTIILQGGV